MDKYRLCPCRSGQNLKFCCGKNKILYKTPANINPPAPKTGIANETCYLSGLCDCHGKITREHYISNSVLNQLKTNNTVKIAGLNWQKAETFDILGSSNLTANILCKRHNEGLSPLDSEFSRFFETVSGYLKGQQSDVSIITEEFEIFSGYDIERWFVKSLIGLLRSKNWKNSDLDYGLNELLMSEGAWPAGAGLYVRTNNTLHQSNSLRIETILKENTSEVAGLQVSICGLDMILALDPSYGWNKLGTYRPGLLMFEARSIQKQIKLTWDGKVDGAEMHLSRLGKEFSGAPSNWRPWERL